MTPTSLDVLVIGAGLSGLTFARLYQQEFPEGALLVLEKSKGLGGRLATRRTDRARFDHGAPFLTPHEKERLGIDGVENARLRSLLTPDGERLACQDGMTGIAKFLARALPIEKETRVHRLERAESFWRADTDSGRSFMAKTVILTAPLPQALSLLEESKIPFPALFGEIRYSMAIVLLFEGEAFPGVPPSNRFKSGPFLSLCDQRWKGISEVPAWVLLVSPERSRTLFEQPEEAIWSSLLPEVREAFPAFSGIKPEIKKWRYSQCENPMEESFGALPDAQGLFLIGDAFHSKIDSSGIERALESAHAFFRVGKSSLLP